MRKNTRVIIFISGVLLLAFGMLGLKEDDKRFQISKGLDIFATLFRLIQSLICFFIQLGKASAMLRR